MEQTHGRHEDFSGARELAGVYLLHFDTPLGNTDNRRATARHYLGSALDVGARLQLHQTGRSGARLLEVCREREISWQLARVWETRKPRKLERWFKRTYKNNRKLCPFCMGTDRAYQAPNRACLPVHVDGDFITITGATRETRT